MQTKEINIKGRVFTIYSDGRVKSDRGFLKPKIKSNEYLYVRLGRGHKRNNFYIHRLVAQAFIPNPENKPFVNHMDGNRQNNSVENLEWVTAYENIWHCKNSGRAKYPDRKPIIQYSLKGEFIAEWDSTKVVAHQFGCTKELFQQAASVNNTKCLTARGYLWIYKKDQDGFPFIKHLKIIKKHAQTRCNSMV